MARPINVPKNDGDNALHGGIVGFNKKVWTGNEIKDGVELTYVSKNGEEGFPGTLTTTVRYTLREMNCASSIPRRPMRTPFLT